MPGYAVGLGRDLGETLRLWRCFLKSTICSFGLFGPPAADQNQRGTTTVFNRRHPLSWSRLGFASAVALSAVSRPYGVNLGF